MQFNIEIISAGPVKTATNRNGGTYNTLEVVYKKNGKVESKKLVDFTCKDVFTALQNAKQGEQYYVDAEKGADGFWAWKTVATAPIPPTEPTQATPPPAATTQGRPTSSRMSANTYQARDFETKEERAWRQRLIVRQSAHNVALDYLKATQPKGVSTSVEEFFALADRIESNVFRNNDKFATMEDDIPQ
jgi:hypothetical protein